MPTTHAEFGPSSLKYFDLCPGYHKENEEDKDTSAADEGTLLHTARETGKFEGLSDDQIEVVEKCRKYIAMLAKKALRTFDELQLQIAGITFGTADHISLCEGEKGAEKVAHLADTKFGYVRVDEPWKNLQMIAYVVGIFETFPSVLKVKVHILHPRLNLIMTHVFTRAEYAGLKDRIGKVIVAARRFRATITPTSCDGSMLRPSVEACTYCGFKGRCPKMGEWLIPAALKYESLPELQEVHASKIEIAGEYAAKYYQVASIIENMGKSAKKHLLELGLMNGGFKDKDGNLLYEVSQRNGNRKVVDLPAFVSILKEKGLTESEMIAFSKISVGDCLSHLGDKKAPKRGKTKFVAEIEAELIEKNAVSYGEPVLSLKKVKAEKAIDVAATAVA